jgi:23S rRNA pseudouridine2605 synthase
MPSAHSPADDRAHPRLQKILAAAGYGSRRQCEELILAGRVEIDRQVVTELGTRVDPSRQHVRVDGVPLKLPRHKYFLLHKPVGVISTARDPWARTRVIDLVAESDRLFTVGRLDKSSSGLILVTNDGDLAHRLTHPRFRVEKTYRVVVAGRPTNETLRQLREGVYLAEGKASAERVSIKKAHAANSELEVVLAEGRNREIRRLLARFGHKVQQLKRVALGPVRLGDLPVGAYRELTRQEVQQLRQATQPKGRPASRVAAERDTMETRRPRGKGGRSHVSPRAGSGRRAQAGQAQAVGRSQPRGAEPGATGGFRSGAFGTVLGADEPQATGALKRKPRRLGRPAQAKQPPKSAARRRKDVRAPAGSARGKSAEARRASKRRWS